MDWEFLPKICCHKRHQVVTFRFLYLFLGVVCVNFVQLHICYCSNDWEHRLVLVVAFGSSCLVAFQSRRPKCYITT